MSKSKKYKVHKSDNPSYISKENIGKKYKNNNVAISKHISTRQINENTEKEEGAIIIGRSIISNLFYYIDIDENSYDEETFNSFVKAKGRIDSSQKRIINAYNVLSDDKEILSKHEAYRRMKGISSHKNHVMGCIDNSKTIHFNGFELAEHIRSYLYAMIYPSVFEICTNASTDIIYSEYPMFLDLWCNMLEEAIILDGICDALHTSILKLLKTEKYNLLFDNGTYSFDIFEDIKKSKNYNVKLIELYKNFVMFACEVDKKRLKNTVSSDHFKNATEMINYQFIQSGNRGIAMKNYIIECINMLACFYNDKNNNAEYNFAKLYSQYNIQRQLHLFDFIWHSEYDSVDFHLTQGFITNYALYKIMRHNNLIYSRIVNSYKNERFEFSKSYRCKSAMELFLEYSIETYDLEFINTLIKRCSKTLQQYDLCFKDKQAQNIYNVISKDVINSNLVDSFGQYLNNLYNDSFTKKIHTIWDASSDYYSKIYEDTKYENVKQSTLIE